MKQSDDQTITPTLGIRSVRRVIPRAEVEQIKEAERFGSDSNESLRRLELSMLRVLARRHPDYVRRIVLGGVK